MYPQLLIRGHLVCSNIARCGTSKDLCQTRNDFIGLAVARPLPIDTPPELQYGEKGIHLNMAGIALQHFRELNPTGSLYTTFDEHKP